MSMSNCLFILGMVLLAAQNLDAQWIPTNPEYFSAVTSFAVFDSTILAGNGDGSLFRSTDMGGTWTNISPSSYGPAIASLASSGNVAIKGHGVYIMLSTDSGSSWQTSLSLDSMERAVPRVYALAASGSEIYAGVNITDGIGRIYRSSDLGTTWADMSDGINFGKTFALVIVPSGTDTAILAGTDRGIYRSTNAGATWKEANEGLSDSAVTSLAAMGQILFAGTRIGIFRSFDYGTSWNATPSALSGHDVSCFAVSGADIFAGTRDQGIFLSTDGGTTWSQVSEGLPGSCVSAMTTARSCVFSGFMDGSICRSTDRGGNWSVVCQGEKSADGTGWIKTCGHAVFAGGASNLYRLSHDGVDWIPALEGSRVLAVTDSAMYVTSDSGVSISVDEGKSWFTPRNTEFPFEPWIDLTTMGREIFLATYPPFDVDTNAGVYVSKDNGETWNVTSLKSRVMGFVAAHGNSVYASVGGTLMSSEDSGRSWHSYTFPSPPPPASYPGAFAIAFRGSEILVASSAGLLRSSNGGKQWLYTASGLSGALYSIVVHGNDVFATTAAVVYHLNRDETSWTAVSGTFPSPEGELASITADDSCLYASFGSTVWKRALSEMIEDVPLSTSNTPTQFSLSQNYPNPFNPATKIQFTIVYRLLTIVKVFDVLGREVATLVNEVKEPGTYTVKFDGSNLASGVYFYRLRAGRYLATHEMILMR